MIILYQRQATGEYYTLTFSYIPSEYYDDIENYWLVPGTKILED